MMAEVTGSGDLKVQLASVAGAGEVSQSAKDFLESRRQVPAGESEPDILYHYTSAAGLIEILKTGNIWATSIRHRSDAVEAVAPSFKDGAFKEEAEWRVVSPLTPTRNCDNEKYRAGRYCPIPYAEFDLPAYSGQLRLENIIVGPTVGDLKQQL